MKLGLAGIGLILLAAAPAPSVLVTTEAPRQGDLPDILTAYGTVSPGPAGRTTLTKMRDGQIAGVAVTAGQAVRRGQHLLDFAATPAAIATYRQAVDAVALARTQQNNADALLSQHLATRDQAAQARKALADAEAALAALRQEGAGSALESLTAPFDGVVESLDVGPGDRTAAGTKLLSLVQADAMVVTAGIEPGPARTVRPGQAVRLTPLAGGEPASGTVARVDAMLNPRSHLVDADIAIPAGTIMLGTAWRADITVGRFHGWLVPRDAVVIDNNGPGVFQIDNDRAVRVGVQVLGADGMTDAVNGDIDPARKLVTQGNAELRDGMAIREAPGH